ncbi:hypothetical protein PFLUV_G00208420 [Perca fluviatilis]|uniref:Secreted protein n=1 Tax=Perca fluviatilis TaxID=8168 RepID=A0A6A5DSG7_PERFL|nr:hypothetical protein PFLUV_G00208420 [Perca fluviatilis]
MHCVLAVLVSVSPQHAQLVLQVADPLGESSSVGLRPLLRLPARLLHLPLVPALHLRRHRLEEVLGHLQSVHVVLLLGKGGFTGLLSKHLQSLGLCGPRSPCSPCGPSGLSPSPEMLLVELTSVPASLPVPEAGFGPAAAAALCGRRQASAPPRTILHHVPILQVLLLPLGVDTEHRTLLGPNHRDS